MLIKGDGVAARCCGHLLGRAGYRVVFETVERARIPAIMLGEQAQKLIRDVFERDDLFRDSPWIARRVVAWGDGAQPVELAHSAVVISEESLLNSLGGCADTSDEADWTIYAAPPLPASTVEHRFGSRMASAMQVNLKADANSCWIESCEGGWLFLISDWLIGVGASVEELLAGSRFVRQQIAEVGAMTARFPASPRTATPLGGAGWIACGSAAMAFDPICGDGTAHAVREAILASAVIRAADAGEDFSSLLDHYETRLRQGLMRHLGECMKFYGSGGSGEWWGAQRESIGEGISIGGGPARYRLIGFDLVSLE